MNGFNSVGAISMAIAKGRFDPNIRLTNMAMSYFQSEENRPAKSLFPILPVQLSTASYYIWSKEDLLRDNVQRKPQFGKVTAQMAFDTEIYRCDVDQIILGMDNIQQLDYQRTNAPSFMLAQNAKTRTISQQMLIHQDIIFANSFSKQEYGMRNGLVLHLLHLENSSLSFLMLTLHLFSSYVTEFLQ